MYYVCLLMYQDGGEELCVVFAEHESTAYSKLITDHDSATHFRTKYLFASDNQGQAKLFAQGYRDGTKRRLSDAR